MTICLKHKEDFETVCPKCDEEKKAVSLKDELVKLYNEKKAYAILYISDLSNNLSKIHKGMNESVIFDNPGCTITLIYPNEMSLMLLQGIYSHVYIDGDIKDRDNVLTYLKLQDGAQVTIVEPIKQQLVR